MNRSLLPLVLIATLSVRAGSFENHGIPVKSTMITATAAGVDEHGEEVLYFDCAQRGNRLFLLQISPQTDAVRQWSAPVGEGAWAMAIAPDKRVYLGTWESGYLLRFDPGQPDKGIESLGKPSEAETYIWQLAEAQDGRLYGCTYPGAKLVRYDPATGKSEDLGRADPEEMYARSVAASTNGYVYIGIGTKRAQIVRFDPSTGSKQPLLRESERPPGTGQVFTADEGSVYAQVGTNAFLCDGDKLKPVTAPPPPRPTKLRDGRVLTKWSVERGRISYELMQAGDAAGHAVRKEAKFEGAGVDLFVIGSGPNGKIFGSTALPLEMFGFDPATRTLSDLGNPTDVGGEIYSFASDATQLYLCAYPGSFLSIYDPARAWNYGKAKDSNPRGIGPMGDGHLRPHAMVIGPDGRVYVGSLPPYGQTGGSMGIYDPKEDKVVENYRHVVTNQGISALCFAPDTKLLFGGSCIEAGGGGTILAREAVVFLWDVAGRKKLAEKVVVTGDSMISVLAAVPGSRRGNEPQAEGATETDTPRYLGARIFGVSLPSSTLFVLNAANGQVLTRAKIPYGNFHDVSLGWHDGHKKLYGLAGQTVFSVDPDTYSFAVVAESKERISCGFAVTDTGIYFGSGTRLMRWRW